MSVILKEYDIESIINIKEVIKSKEKAKEENLFVKSLKLNDKQYYLIKYDRNKVTINNENKLGLFKSIFCDEENIYSFCPPKKITFESFIETNNAFSYSLFSSYNNFNTSLLLFFIFFKI